MPFDATRILYLLQDRSDTDVHGHLRQRLINHLRQDHIRLTYQKSTNLSPFKEISLDDEPWLDEHEFTIEEYAVYHMVPHLIDDTGLMTRVNMGLLLDVASLIGHNCSRVSIDHFLQAGIRLRHLPVLFTLGFELNDLSVPLLFKTRNESGSTITCTEFLDYIKSIPRPSSCWGNGSLPSYDWLFTRDLGLSHDNILSIHYYFKSTGWTLTDCVIHNSMGLHGFKYFKLLLDEGVRCRKNHIVEAIVTSAGPSDDGTNYDAPPTPFNLEERKKKLVELRSIIGHATCSFSTLPSVAYVMDNDYLDWLLTEGFRPDTQTFSSQMLGHHEYGYEVPAEQRQRVILWLDNYLLKRGESIDSSDGSRYFQAVNYLDHTFNEQTHQFGSKLYDFCKDHVTLIRQALEARDQRQQEASARRDQFKAEHGISEDDVQYIQKYLGRSNGVCPHYKNKRHNDCPDWPKCQKYHGAVEDTYRCQQCTDEDCSRDSYICTKYHYATPEQLQELEELQQYNMNPQYGERISVRKPQIRCTRLMQR